MLLPRFGRPERTAATEHIGVTDPGDGATMVGHGLFFIAHNVSNLLNYAFLLAMSQALTPTDFALFAALFGTVYLASALANTVQTSVAAAVAGAGCEAAPAVVGATMRRVIMLALPLAAGVLVVARPVAAFFHSGDTTSVALTGVAVWLFLVAAVGYGGLQGTGRFTLLGAGLIVAAVGRLVLGPVFLWLGLGVPGALLGVAVGLGLSAALVMAPFARSGVRPVSAFPRPVATVLAALLVSVAIAVPTSADVVLAQHFFPGEEAGAYAAVSVLGKVIIFAPLAISVIFFPLVVRREAEGGPTTPLLRLALLATAAVSVPLAATVVAAGVAAPEVVLRGYAVSSALLCVYVAGTLVFSFVVTVLYFNLATRADRIVSCVAVGLAVELAIVVLWHPDVLAMALVLLVGNVGLLVLGLAGAWGLLAQQAGGSPRARLAAAASALQD